MGHRCNYVSRRNGELQLIYSHWGALTVPRDFFWGLAAAEEFLDEHQPCDDSHWLDDVFGEGGAALDHDNKVLTIDGGEIYGHARDLLFELMRAVWARDGYSVRDAESFVDIATAVGLPASTVEAEHIPAEPIDVTDDACVGRDDGYFDTLVVVDGVIRFCAARKCVLELGPARVGELASLPDLAEAKQLSATRPPPSWESERRSMRERLLDAIVIDTRERRVDASLYELSRGTSRRHYQERWPGYQVTRVTLDDALGRLGHPDLPPSPPAPVPSIEDQLGEIEQYLFGTRSDPIDLMTVLIQQYPGGVVNPHAMVSPVDGRPDNGPHANALFREVLSEVLAKR